MANITLEILKKHSPFFVKDLAEELKVPYHKVNNMVNYHKHLFEFESVKEDNTPGRPRKKVYYVGVEKNADNGE